MKDELKDKPHFISKIAKAIKALFTRTITIECDRIPYTFRHVPFKKLMNWILVEASIFIKPSRPWGYPTHLQVEPASYCNLRCALCPVTDGMHRGAGTLDIGLFKRLIDEIGSYVFLIMLWDWGEPFLNPHIYEMISYAKQKGIKVVSSTNGHVFKDKEHVDNLLRCGLDTLIVAVDGMTQDTYELYRKGGSLSHALEGIRNIVAQKQETGYSAPLVNLRFIAMKHNEHQIPHLKQWARSLGVDVLSIKTLNPCANDTYREGKIDNLSGGEFLNPADISYKRFHYARGTLLPIMVRRNPCKNLWNAPTVHFDGTVCPCTYDYNERYVFGKLASSSFKDIWFGRPYLQMRRTFRKSWKSIPFCANCSYAYEGGSCIDETIADAVFFKSGDDACPSCQ
jgi:radical SAM protein with 4Fe4S-binding SPASM domain